MQVNRRHIIAGMVGVSCAVFYCSVPRNTGTTPIKDAAAQLSPTCGCTNGATYNKIAEGDWPPGGTPMTSPPIKVGAYREVIYYPQGLCNPSVLWRPDESVPFSPVQNGASLSLTGGARIQVQGSEMQLAANSGCMASSTVHWVLAGVNYCP